MPNAASDPASEFGAPSLDELRRRIDEVDDAMHDLLMQRTRLVEGVAALKRREGLPALRPAREALLIRRLLRRHQGALPRDVVVRIWREIISAHTGLQASFTVAVLMPPQEAGYWDLARDHFGSCTRMLSFGSVPQVIGAVIDGQASVGILPVPQEGGDDPWWRYLVRSDASAPRVVARLPVGGEGNARTEGEALVIAKLDCEPTGADRSLVVVETRGDISRARLIDVFRQHGGLTCRLYTSFEPAPGTGFALLELEGFIDANGDARLAAVSAACGDAIGFALPIGAYAEPLRLIDGTDPG